MATQPATETRYTGAWRWGLLFGILQVALQYGVTLVLGYLLPEASAGVRNLADNVLFGLCLLLCGCAGYIAARKSGNPNAGNSAGLYAGVVGAGIMITLGLLLSTASRPLQQLLQLLQLKPFFLVVTLGCTLGIYAILGLVAGVIGGKLAQRSMARAG